MKRQLWVMMIIVGAWAVSVRGQVAVESFRKSKLNADTSQSLGLQFDYLSGNSEILMLKPTYRIDFMTPVGQSFVVANLQYGNRSGVNSVNQGLIHWRDIRDLGPLLVGRYESRTSPDQITLFKGVGLGVADICLGQAVLERARQRSLGHELSW